MSFFQLKKKSCNYTYKYKVLSRVEYISSNYIFSTLIDIAAFVDQASMITWVLKGKSVIWIRGVEEKFMLDHLHDISENHLVKK